MQIHKFLLCLALLLMVSGAARAQNIPPNIPDGPESLDEKNDRRLIERHRSLLSGLFTGSSIGVAMPAFNVGVGPTVRVSGGYVMAGGDAIYGSVRRYLLRLPGAESSAPLRGAPVVALAVQYEERLNGMIDGRLGRYLAVAFGAELLRGATDGVSLTVTPKLVLPVNRYWSLPLGVTVGSAVVTNGPRHLFVGAHVGVRLHLFALLGGGHGRME